MNAFMSKVEKLYYFDNIHYMHIVLKGRKRYDLDERKYFIRFTFDDSQTLEWGETFYINKIEVKVKGYLN
jgi:hypothetical protein